MNRIYLEYHDEEQNKHRFYQLFVMVGLFSDWSLVREWGRIGSAGTVRKDIFETEAEAELARIDILQQKVKKGDCLLS